MVAGIDKVSLYTHIHLFLALAPAKMGPHSFNDLRQSIFSSLDIQECQPDDTLYTVTLASLLDLYSVHFVNLDVIQVIRIVTKE